MDGIFLGAAYPNPFNPTTTIRYGIEDRTHVTISVYNVAGQLVRTLVDEVQGPLTGRLDVRWDGTDNSGEPVASGVYYYRLVAGTSVRTKRMVLLK